MMTTPMTAGKPLAAPRQHRDPPRRRGLIVRFLRGLLGGLIGLVLLLGAGGAVGGWIAWQHFSADLPDVDGLLHYQPPVMSRVYAGDARPLAELASERRIFVPLEAIPDLVRELKAARSSSASKCLDRRRSWSYSTVPWHSAATESDCLVG